MLTITTSNGLDSNTHSQCVCVFQCLQSVCMCVGGDIYALLGHAAWLTKTVALKKAFSKCVTCHLHCTDIAEDFATSTKPSECDSSSMKYFMCRQKLHLELNVRSSASFICKMHHARKLERFPHVVCAADRNYTRHPTSLKISPVLITVLQLQMDSTLFTFTCAGFRM